MRLSGHELVDVETLEDNVLELIALIKMVVYAENTTKILHSGTRNLLFNSFFIMKKNPFFKKLLAGHPDITIICSEHDISSEGTKRGLRIP